MATGAMWSLCLLLVCFQFGAARSESKVLHTGGGGGAENARAPPGSARRALSAPSITHDGCLVACSGKDLLGFQPNGSFAWTVPLGHTCNDSIAPVFEGEQVYLVAEDKIMKVTLPQSVHTAEPALEVFFSHNVTSEEIIGLAISGTYSSLFLTIRNRGLFAFSLRGKLQWSIGPALNLFDYRLGCKKNVSGCYFDSAPVIDQCEGALYISNTEGQLYSLYIDNRGLRWIQDLSSHDKVMTVAPGNSVCLYIVFPRKSIVVGIDVSTGSISWTQNIGPISNEKNLPTVDSNGWMSIGSLDGTLYSISPDGDMRKFPEKTANDSVIHVGPVLDCSGFSMYVAKTIVEGKLIQTTGDYTYVSAKKPSFILFTLLAPANGTIYWTEEYPGELSNLLSNSDLNYFTIDENVVLTLLSATRTGISNTTECYTRRQKIAWTCSQAKPQFVQAADPGEPSYVLLLIFLLVVIVIQAVALLFCCIFWRKKRLRDKGLHKFLEKRRSLHSKRRIIGKKILQLEQKAAEDASSNEALGQLGEMVKAKEGVEKKLHGSYSLGRDEPNLEQQGTSLPLYHGEYSRSHSFHSSQNGSITVFNIPSDTSSSEDSTSSFSDDTESCSGTTSSGEMEPDVRSTPAEEAGPSNTANVKEEVQHELGKQQH